MSFLQKVDRLLRTKESIFRELEEEKTHRKWGNEDLDPSPQSARTWGYWNYFAFFWAISFTPTVWNTGSSLISVGLLWWQATLAGIVACMIMGFLLMLNSRGASVYHLGYPVFVRASAGLYGSLWFVFVRGIIAIFFFSTQNYYGAELVNVMLRCCFGSSWTNLPNHLPASAGITTGLMVAFIIFWITQLGFMLIHPSKSRWLYTVKSLLAPPVLIATFAFIVGKTGSLGATRNLGTVATSYSAVGWGFMTGINSVAGGLITEVSSNPDLARYSKHPRNTSWPQLVGLVMAKSLCIFLGIGASSAVKTIWGTAYWNLWDLYSAILNHYWNPGARCAVFLACLVQIVAIIATNLAANAVPVGCDLTGLFPRYFNIIRGQVLCAVLAIACVPWKLVSSAAGFLTFLGSNVVFLSPLVAIMIVDYFIIRKGNIHVPSLYNPHADSPYWYKGGFNVRAFVAWVVAVLSVIHGLGGSFDKHWNVGSVHIYSIGMLMSSTVAGTLYCLFCYIWPVMVYPLDHADEPRTREYLRRTDGFFESDVIIGIDGGGGEEGTIPLEEEYIIKA